jgi:hypothetical protein
MTTIAGHIVWLRGLRGFYAEKRPADYLPRMTKEENKEPVAIYPLGAEEYALKLSILEQRYPPPKEPPRERPALVEPPTPPAPSS